MSKIKLFCFPFAGGSATLYNNWKPYLKEHIELIPIELAGRGTRMGEPLYASLETAINDVFNLIKEDIKQTPYALLGHSLGGIIINELALKIRALGLPEPKHVFFSGNNPLHIKNDEKNYHLLDEETFKDKILELGGTPPEFFKHPELLDIFLPLLRNDFKLASIDFSKRPIDPFKTDITVFMGIEDTEIHYDKLYQWKHFTKEKCTMHFYNGDHFFLHDEIEHITSVLNETLLKVLSLNKVAASIG